jgi:hypothetical protein
LPPADWSTCCIHPSDRRRASSRLLEVFQYSSRSIASLRSKRCRSQPFNARQNTERGSSRCFKCSSGSTTSLGLNVKLRSSSLIDLVHCCTLHQL